MQARIKMLPVREIQLLYGTDASRNKHFRDFQWQVPLKTDHWDWLWLNTKPRQAKDDFYRN